MRRNQAIKRQSKRPDSEARPTWLLTRTRTRAFRSTRPTPAGNKVRGKRSGAPAWAHRPGRGSSPSSTRGGHSLARGAWMVPPKHCHHSTRLPRRTSTRSPRPPPLPQRRWYSSGDSIRSAASGARGLRIVWDGFGGLGLEHTRNDDDRDNGQHPTGLGSPNGAALVNDLVASTTHDAVTTIRQQRQQRNRQRTGEPTDRANPAGRAALEAPSPSSPTPIRHKQLTPRKPRGHKLVDRSATSRQALACLYSMSGLLSRTSASIFEDGLEDVGNSR